MHQKGGGNNFSLSVHTGGGGGGRTPVSGRRSLPSLRSHVLSGGGGYPPSPVTGPVQSPAPGPGGYPSPGWGYPRRWVGTLARIEVPHPLGQYWGSPPPHRTGVPPTHHPTRVGHATDRIRRGRYASCVFTQRDFLVYRRYVVESNVDEYKAVHVCLEEFARQQRLQNEKNPEWYLFGMKDARDGDQKLLQIKVKLKQEYSPALCRTNSNFWIGYQVVILNIH